MNTVRGIDLPSDGSIPFKKPRTLEDWAWYSQIRSLILPLPENRQLQSAWVRSLYVPTHRDKDLAKAVGVTLHRSGASQRRWLGLDGESNIGKTELTVNLGIQMSGFQDGKPSVSDGGYTQLPVLYVEATTSSDGSDLLRSMLRFAGIPDSIRSKDLWRVADETLPKLGTKVCIVDEAHKLSRTSSSSRKLPNDLREIIGLPVVFLFVGAGLEGSALRKTGRVQQFAPSKQMILREEELHLEPLLLPRDNRTYDEMLNMFAAKVKRGIPGMRFSGLTDKIVRKQLYEKTGGMHALIFSNLKDATVLALELGTLDVTEQLLSRLWPQDFGQPHRFNPNDWPDEIAAYDVG